MPAYEVCWSCRGSGLQDGMHGLVSCWVCHGDGCVIKRDERGRFVADSVAVGPTREDQR
jgi:DnaJ-class molecular chaperone